MSICVRVNNIRYPTGFIVLGAILFLLHIDGVTSIGGGCQYLRMISFCIRSGRPIKMQVSNHFTQEIDMHSIKWPSTKWCKIRICVRVQVFGCVADRGDEPVSLC